MAERYGKRQSLRDIYQCIRTVALTLVHRSSICYRTQTTFEKTREAKLLASRRLDIKSIFSSLVCHDASLQLAAPDFGGYSPSILHSTSRNRKAT